LFDFVRESYLEFSFSLANPLNLLTPELRKLKTNSDHVVVLEYTHDPIPALLRHRFKIIEGRLENIDELCKAAEKDEEKVEGMKYSLSEAGLRVGRENMCEKLEEEAKGKGGIAIRIPIYFKHFQGHHREIVPLTIIMMDKGWGNDGESDWVGGLTLGLQMPPPADMYKEMARLTARNLIRDILDDTPGKQGQFIRLPGKTKPLTMLKTLSCMYTVSTKPYSSSIATRSPSCDSSTPLALPPSLQTLVDSPLRCDPLRCISPGTPLPAIIHTSAYVEVVREALQRVFNSFLYSIGQMRTTRAIVDDELDIQAIAQMIGQLGLDQIFRGGKPLGELLGTRLILQMWRNQIHPPVFDHIVGTTFKTAGLMVNEFGFFTCLHDGLATDLDLIRKNMERMEQMNEESFLKGIETKHRRRLFDLVRDLLDRNVAEGPEWQNPCMWGEMLARIHDDVFAGLEVGLKSLIFDPTFMPIQKHFFSTFTHPVALIASAGEDWNEKTLGTMVQRIGINAESDFMLRGGLLGMAEAKKKKSKAQKKKEKRKVVMRRDD
jgi:hypothetical protein